MFKGHILHAPTSTHQNNLKTLLMVSVLSAEECYEYHANISPVESTLTF